MIKYRKANIFDIGQIHSILMKNLPEIQKYDDSEIAGIKIEIENDLWIRKYLETDNFPIFVAEIDVNENKEIIGYILAYSLSLLNPVYQNNDNVHITNFDVLKEFRNQGIGKHLLAEVEKWAGENGCKAIFIDVYTENKIARDFYEKSDYKIVKELRKKLIRQPV